MKLSKSQIKKNSISIFKFPKISVSFSMFIAIFLNIKFGILKFL